MADKKETIKAQLQALEEIAGWFEKEEDFDVEEGLEKVKEGVALVKKLKERIKKVENEFNTLEAELTEKD